MATFLKHIHTVAILYVVNDNVLMKDQYQWTVTKQFSKWNTLFISMFVNVNRRREAEVKRM